MKYVLMVLGVLAMLGLLYFAFKAEAQWRAACEEAGGVVRYETTHQYQTRLVVDPTTGQSTIKQEYVPVTNGVCDVPHPID